jgi:hypothetical protein
MSKTESLNRITLLATSGFGRLVPLKMHADDGRREPDGEAICEGFRITCSMFTRLGVSFMPHTQVVNR